MRIKLLFGKQKELLLLAKKQETWKDLSLKLKLNQNYLVNELFKETRTLSEDTYKLLNDLTGKNFDEFIVERLENYWGKSKGGKNAVESQLKYFKPVSFNNFLAELCGIILGDGHLEYYQNGKKIRSYSLTVTGHSVKDSNYLRKYVNNLIKQLFNYDSRFKNSNDGNGLYLVVNGKRLIEFFEKIGIKPGNKKINSQGIPAWILENKDYLAACLRGLMDTDGSIHYISKHNRNLRITFTSYIPKLLDDVRESLLRLGFHPSKIIKGNQIFITRKEDIQLYLKLIGFSNDKHLNRLQNFQKKASVE
ncbi:hypothetical protein FJZ21_01700 [Candidatus Pacearchaeota archaeon]|nr:hypothetical protein [Candidatus Pacearchaeota archaeon]